MTLPETLLALVLLAACILMVARLFQRASREQIKSMNLQRSASMAESVLERIRDWAGDPANFFSDWSTYDGKTVTDPAYPGLEAEVKVKKDRVLYSACAASESQYSSSEQRTLTNSTVWVRVRAGGVELVTAVGAPAREVATVSITSASAGPVPHDASVTYTAKAFDGGGRPIPDIFFDWRVVSVDDGSWADLATNRIGRSATLTHSAWHDEGWTANSRVRLEVEYRYHGKWERRASADIVLQ